MRPQTLAQRLPAVLLALGLAVPVAAAQWQVQSVRSLSSDSLAQFWQRYEAAPPGEKDDGRGPGLADYLADASFIELAVSGSDVYLLCFPVDDQMQLLRLNLGEEMHVADWWVVGGEDLIFSEDDTGSEWPTGRAAVCLAAPEAGGAIVCRVHPWRHNLVVSSVEADGRAVTTVGLGIPAVTGRAPPVRATDIATCVSYDEPALRVDVLHYVVKGGPVIRNALDLETYEWATEVFENPACLFPVVAAAPDGAERTFFMRPRDERGVGLWECTSSGAVPVSGTGDYLRAGPFCAVVDPYGMAHLVCPAGTGPRQDGLLHYFETADGWRSELMSVLTPVPDRDTVKGWDWKPAAPSACLAPDGGLNVAFFDCWAGTVNWSRKTDGEWKSEPVDRSRHAAATAIAFVGDRPVIAFADPDAGEVRVAVAATAPPREPAPQS